ncbi:MAG: hypothetical protein OXK79_01380 [Chloroflexota bacterium]|nr:hypothetical protein [Chloroflexota bacterium]
MPRFRKRAQASDEGRDESEIERQQATRSVLWNLGHEGDADTSGALLTQYGTYVESAEKVSHRRGIANNFFLLVNSAASVALAALGLTGDEAATWPLFFSATVMIGICVVWGFTVHSYRQLSSAKWSIVNALEERLPAAPWTAEWQLLDRGGSRRSYRRLTTVEKWVPSLFASIYAVGFVTLALIV